ncbi:unnamed protein product, partial [Caenorhabditis sp. 36 PRJEB53466]
MLARTGATPFAFSTPLSYHELFVLQVLDSTFGLTAFVTDEDLSSIACQLLAVDSVVSVVRADERHIPAQVEVDCGVQTVLNAECCLQMEHFVADLSFLSPLTSSPERTFAEIQRCRRDYGAELRSFLLSDSAKPGRSFAAAPCHLPASRVSPVKDSASMREHADKLRQSCSNVSLSSLSNLKLRNTVAPCSTKRKAAAEERWRRCSDAEFENEHASVSQPRLVVGLAEYDGSASDSDSAVQKIRLTAEAQSASKSSSLVASRHGSQEKKESGLRVKLTKLMGSTKAAKNLRWSWRGTCSVGQKDVVAGMTVLMEFAKEHIAKLRKRVATQLQQDIGCPASVSPDERKKRQLCRIPLHLKTDDGKKYVSINDAYTAAWCDFVGVVPVSSAPVVVPCALVDDAERFDNSLPPIQPLVTQHTQRVVERKFCKAFEQFASSMLVQEDRVCAVCRQLTCSLYIRDRPYARYATFLGDLSASDSQEDNTDDEELADSFDSETEKKKKKKEKEKEQRKKSNKKKKSSHTIVCCDICHKSMTRRSQPCLPAAATLNKFRDVPDVPQLSCLNSIEKMLIERSRPLQKILFLHSISGKKTSMRSTNAVMVVVPTEIAATVDHVVSTLPSESNLIIDVRTGWEKTYVVRLPKVIAALEFLKTNHPFYADITINPDFRFGLGDSVIFEDATATQSDADALVSREDTPGQYILTQDMVHVQPVRRVQQQRDSATAFSKYTLKKQVYAPKKISSKDLDLDTFPLLHPFGDDGMHATRATFVRLSKYIRTRLLNVDRRFATNAKWSCFMFAYKQQLAITSVQGVLARVSGAPSRKEFDATSVKSQKVMTSLFHKMRGYPQYWKSVKLDLRSSIATFGTPSWFVTLNPNIKGWTDLHALYNRVLQRTDITEHTIETAISTDPVIFARYWRRKVLCFMRDIVCRPEGGPLGIVTHWFYRVEYQHRGTQHVHCLFWTSDKPNVSASASEVEAYLDRHITCRIPDKETEQELYALVIANQLHWANHSSTCRRKRKIRGRWSTDLCRFNFPRQARQKTIFYSDSTIKSMPNSRARPYYLARTADESLVNDYSPGLLLRWGGNIDTQFIPDGVRDMLNYVTGYTTKGEKAKRANDKTMSNLAMQNLRASKIVWNVGMTMLENREVGMLEIMDDLLSHSNFSFDTAHVFVHNDPVDDRARVLVPQHRLVDDDSRMTEANWNDDFYPGRPRQFENFSLYNIVTNFEIVTAKPDSTIRRSRFPSPRDTDVDDYSALWHTINADKKTAEEDADDEVFFGDEDLAAQARLNDTSPRYHCHDRHSPFYCHPGVKPGEKFEIPSCFRKFMRKIKPKIGRFHLPPFNADALDEGDDHFRRLVVVFVPWRDERLIKARFSVDTYRDVWRIYLKTLKKESPDARADVDLLMAGYEKIMKEESDYCNRMDHIKKIKERLEIDEEAVDKLEIQPRTVDAAQHATAISGLNAVQKDIFDLICSRIAQQEAVEVVNNEARAHNNTCAGSQLERKELRERPTPIRMFVSGTAGTGKSFLINILADELTQRYTESGATGVRPAVLIAAPTGIAALAIDGNTIHSLFSIKVSQYKKEEDFESLDNKLDELRFLFSSVKLIIVDEVSMVSNVVLMKIHRRLKEISGDREIFGGFNVLLFGDLLQLPPVRAMHAFKEIPRHEMHRIFGAMHVSINLWRTLQYRELLENMRQKEELKMVQMLCRIRCGAQTPEDIALLMTRMIPAKVPFDPTPEEDAAFFLELLKTDSCAMALFPTNEEVNRMNATIVELIKLDTIEIMAKDVVEKNASDFITRKLKQRTGSKPWNRMPLHRLKPHLQKRLPDAGSVDVGVDRQMRSGLPYRLVVAVGARVMLRQNVDISMRLVNGATGVVTKIVFDSVNTRPSWIYVRWDGDPPFEVPICERQVFFVRDEDVVSRSQFPLVLSYAASIHKAQGLTLKNVFVRPKNIFSGGMFYVAISRVTCLTGLHLSGFAESKIFHDPDALKEADRLRRLIKLLPLQDALKASENDNKTVAVTIAPTLKQVPSPSSSLSSAPSQELLLNRTQESVGVVQESQKSRLSTRSQRVAHFLWTSDAQIKNLVPRLTFSPTVENETAALTESVAIALLHSVTMMEQLHTSLLSLFQSLQGNEEDEDVTFMSIRLCLLRANNDTSDLIQSVGGSAATMFGMIASVLTALPANLRSCFERRTEVTSTCSRCKNVSISARPRQFVWLEAEDSLFGHLHLVVDEHCRRATPVDRRCDKLVDGIPCGGKTVEIQTCGSGSKYLFVVQPAESSSYLPLKSDPVLIGRSRFLLLGAVGLRNRDAYELPTVWYRSPESGWLCSDNGGVTLSSNSFLEMSNLNFFVYVEKAYARATSQARLQEKEEDMVLDDFQDLRNDASFSSHDDGEGEHHSRRAATRPGIIAAGHPPTVSDWVDNEDFTSDPFAPDPAIDAVYSAILEQSGPPSKPYLLLLNANGNDCFLNSAVNILFSCTDLRKQLIIRPFFEMEKSEEALLRSWYEMRQLFSRASSSPVRMRNALPQPLHSGQQDIRDVLVFMFECLHHCSDSFILDTVLVHWYKQTTCDTVGCVDIQSRSKTAWHTHLFLTDNNPLWDLNEAMQERWCPQRSKCSKCSSGVVMLQSHVFHSPKYHLVFANQNEARLDFDVCRH